MGLIKAISGALGGTLADQWKEFFYCDALDKDVLVTKGQKRTSRRSSNKMCIRDRNNTLYLVIPCYNEEEVFPETLKRLTEKLNDMIHNNLISEKSRMLFVDDGSKDKTWQPVSYTHLDVYKRQCHRSQAVCSAGCCGDNLVVLCQGL